VFLTSALDGDEWATSRPGYVTPRERAPGTQWLGSWLGPRVGLDEATERSKTAAPRNRTSARPEWLM